MNEKAIRILEYPKIITQLTECATSAPGKNLCRELLPSADLDQILSLQSETADALRRIYAKGSFAFQGLRDLRADFRRLEIGSALGIAELLSVGRLLELAAKARKYEDADEENKAEVEDDSLSALFRSLDPVPSLSREIRRCILSEEEIADDASPALKRIRRQIALSQERIKLSDLRENELISTYEKEHSEGMYEEKLEDTTINYFYALYMLSKCDSFVCSGRCNGSDIVLSLNNGRFSNCYKFSVGVTTNS